MSQSGLHALHSQLISTFPSTGCYSCIQNECLAHHSQAICSLYGHFFDTYGAICTLYGSGSCLGLPWASPGLPGRRGLPGPPLGIPGPPNGCRHPSKSCLRADPGKGHLGSPSTSQGTRTTDKPCPKWGRWATSHKSPVSGRSAAKAVAYKYYIIPQTSQPVGGFLFRF